MKGDLPAWLVAVSENRDSLERIAKHGQTGLSEDVARLLEEAERMESQYDVPGSPKPGPRTVGQQDAAPDVTGGNKNATEVDFVSWDRISELVGE